MQARKLKGWTQAELADKAESNRDLIGRYERDDTMPGADIAGRIAEALGISLDYLILNKRPGNADPSQKLAQLSVILEALPPSDLEHVAAVADAFHTKSQLQAIMK